MLTSTEDALAGTPTWYLLNAPFAETSYGIVKRIQVIGEWIGQIRQGRENLA